MTLRGLDWSVLKSHDITELHEPITKEENKGNHDNSSNATFEYIYIGNIPPDYRSADLRWYFRDFIERCVFKCFHYRHRPEKTVVKDTKGDNDGGGGSDNVADGDMGNHPNDIQRTHSKLNNDIESFSTEQNESGSSSSTTTTSKQKQNRTCCCIATIYTDNVTPFINKYNGKEWCTRNRGSFGKLTTHIKRLNLQNRPDHVNKYKSKKDIREGGGGTDRDVYIEDMESSIELNPPQYILPNGNVGTSTKYFHGLIRECKMPPSLIKSLDLEFPKCRKLKAYSMVPPPQYEKRRRKYKHSPVGDKDEDDEQSSHREKCTVEGGKQNKTSTVESESESSQSTAEKESEHYPRNKDSTNESESAKYSNTSSATESPRNPAGSDDEEEKEEDVESSEEEGAEDWERHEALHDDLTRAKERLFEEDIELKWEKGGSGIVWYTDSYFWNELKGKDFDEDTTDDWDVDYSIYYQQGAGDKPARDQHDIRTSNRRRQGKNTDISPTKLRRKERSYQRNTNMQFGDFERFTTGFGSRIMKKQGWEGEGSGVGAGEGGIKEPIGNEGQAPKDRTGLGWYGEKLDRSVDVRPKVEKEVRIRTVYDGKVEEEGEP